MTIVNQTLNLVSPYAIGKIINILQLNGQNGIDEALQWLLLLSGITVMIIIFNNTENIIERALKQNINHSFLKDFYNKAQTLPLLWHQDHHSGDLVSRLNKANGALETFINVPSQIIWSSIGFFGPAIILMKIMPAVGIYMMIISIIIVGLMVFLDKKIKKQSKTSNDFYHKIFTALNDYLGNIRTIIILRLGIQTQNDIKKRLSETIPPYKKETKLKVTRWLSSEFLIELSILSGIAYVLYAFRKNDQSIQVGTIVMVVNYLRQMSYSVYNSSRNYSNTIQAVTDYEGLELINKSYADYIKDHKINAHALQNWSTIIIKDLSFSYSSDLKTSSALKHLHFSINSGQKIALVGASGGGKSTLMSVLRGLYPAQAGISEIDGTTYTSIEPLASISTLIPQEPEIFENTIRYNITLGVEHSDDEIMEACRIACFDTVINELPNGLDSKINEKGVNLSGGQKQRLALARGIFAIQDSSLVLFDEPTSSVDSLTERLMYKNLFTAFPHICLISSIHRLNLLNQFDTIWVMQHGRLVQQGSLSELLTQTDQPFYKLWIAYQSEESI